jgi:metallophosphoesterase (TIGR00282 family)
MLLKILFIGDIFGEPGRRILKARMPEMLSLHSPDFVIANGENASGGKGITYNVAQEILSCGVDAITMGNHTWFRKEILGIIDSGIRIIRPANYPKGAPGRGKIILDKNGMRLGVINLLGRVYMEGPADCPFQAADRELQNLKGQTDAVLIDFHAEATSEKTALAYYIDGRAECIVGTHTHVQTADERILEKGTAYITDVGFTGPYDGIIGVDRGQVIKRFTLGIPAQFEPAAGRMIFSAVLVEVDPAGKRAVNIRRITDIMNG